MAVRGEAGLQRPDRADDVATLDLRGLKCPLPVLKAEKRLAAMANGSRLRLLATDPMAAIDIPNFCRETGHRLCLTEREGDVTIFEIEKAR